MNTRISRSLYFCLVLSLCTLSCHKEEEKIKGCTDPHSYNYSAEAEENDASCKSLNGCLGYTANQTNSGSLGVTLYNAAYDADFIQHINEVQSFFGQFPTAVYVWYEPDNVMNALSTPEHQIYFGYNMFYRTVSMYGTTAIIGILAHEWAHQIQFHYGWQSQGVLKTELEADAFSGFYMGFAMQWSWLQIEGYYANTYSLGNYEFNHPQFHGTPDQRLAAAYLGVQTALEVISSGEYPLYTELHEMFQNSISSNILSPTAPDEENTSEVYNIAKGLSRGHEFLYPRTMDKEEIARLRPRMEKNGL